MASNNAFTLAHALAPILSTSHRIMKPALKPRMPRHILEQVIWNLWTSRCSTKERIHTMTILSLVNTTFRDTIRACEARHIFMSRPSYVPVFFSRLVNSRSQCNRNALGAFGITVHGGDRDGKTSPDYDSCSALTLHLDLTDVLTHNGGSGCGHYKRCIAGQVRAAETMIRRAMRRFLSVIAHHKYFPLLQKVALKFVNMDAPHIVNTLHGLTPHIPTSVRKVEIEIVRNNLGECHPTEAAKLYCCWRCSQADVNYCSPQWFNEWEIDFRGMEVELRGREQAIDVLGQWIEYCSDGIESMVFTSVQRRPLPGV
ncbi:hypothetical protein AX16_010032 [Volvariella volvacea WC 439]|nr:hypothetical protein AX16_010032 [Volvariella volvacea WC 439]